MAEAGSVAPSIAKEDTASCVMARRKVSCRSAALNAACRPRIAPSRAEKAASGASVRAGSWVKFGQAGLCQICMRGISTLFPSTYGER